MRKIYFFIASMFFVTVYSQKKIDCTPKIKQYKTLFDASNYNDAYDSWSFVFKNCPKTNETLYTDGIKILSNKIENSEKAFKESAVRELVALYDQYYKYYPNSVKDFEVKKALLLYDNRVAEKEEINPLIESGVSKNIDIIERITAFNLYMEVIYAKYLAQDKTVSKDVLIDKYELVNARFIQLEKQIPEKANDYIIAQKTLRNRFKNDISCSDFEVRVARDFEAKKEDVVWLINALHNMSGKCSGSDTFYNAAKKLYELKPDAFSTYQLALSSIKQRKMDEGKALYLQSIELESDPVEKAETYYVIGTLEFENIPVLKQYMQKAIQTNPKMSRAYLYLAQLYATNADRCAKDDFEKKTIYYLAYTLALKAGEVDEKFKPSAESIAKKYLESAPTKEEIATQNLQGKTVSIGCDFNETVTFPEN